ncbi:FecR domain-containing protein [Mucilaginibacter sp. ZT4R22]|uniref:FecR domain-containing protein n=1 Tax=Mucilaginibacter pankratovii TaxID=2772110 RepID=A0ABR7WK27_9SPHI|nr:FecR domain-containing protein [Mucilaginibacter pankratovii]MBD1362660.1 FecR domain-containing protein [Mucilaginibacter pankratovii]
MQEPENKDLLKKYIGHQCSPEELALVLKYIQLPEGRQALEYLLLNEWNAFEADDAEPGHSEQWHALLDARIKQHTAPSFTARYSWLKYAAIFIMVTGIGAWLLLERQPKETLGQIALVEKYNPRGQRTRITLQDSSVVYLGADSRLRYPELLNGSTREIFLEGEAFFEVKHDVKHPFIVHTGKVQTQVLGTSFKIEAFKDQRLTVAVATGKVSVGYKDQANALRSLAVLTPGKEVSVNAVNKAEINTVAIVDIKGWVDGSLAFTDARLDEIFRELERWYNVKIIIKGDKLKAYSLSINVNGKAPITLALDAITGATGLKYRIDQNQIIISPQ